MYEGVHRRLALGQLYGTILIPERLVAYHGIHLMLYLGLALEQLVRQIVEGIVVVARCLGDEQVAYHLVDVYLGGEVVDRQCPFAVGQFCIFLRNLHVSHEVYVSTLRQSERAFLYMQ